MRNRTRVLLAGAVLVVAAAVPSMAMAGGGSNDGNERDIPITGPELSRASEAAISHLGGGTVTETEIDDEESYYEVEVTLEDGSQVDVQLDEGFDVVGTESDGMGSDD